MDPSTLQCSNCETKITPLWRRSANGAYLCNACGLYYKIHQTERPKELKTENFRNRHRTRRIDNIIDKNLPYLRQLPDDYINLENQNYFNYPLQQTISRRLHNNFNYKALKNKEAQFEDIEILAAEALIQLSKSKK